MGYRRQPPLGRVLYRHVRRLHVHTGSQRMVDRGARLRLRGGRQDRGGRGKRPDGPAGVFRLEHAVEPPRLEGWQAGRGPLAWQQPAGAVRRPAASVAPHGGLWVAGLAPGPLAVSRRNAEDSAGGRALLTSQAAVGSDALPRRGAQAKRCLHGGQGHAAGSKPPMPAFHLAHREGAGPPGLRSAGCRAGGATAGVCAPGSPHALGRFCPFCSSTSRSGLVLALQPARA